YTTLFRSKRFFMNQFRAAQQTDQTDHGYLQIQVVSSENNFPIPDATITIRNETSPDTVLEELHTNSSGQTDTITLPSPPLEYSLNPGEPRPYSEYSIQITPPGFEPLNIDGTEVLSGATSIQDARLRPIALGDRKSTRLNSSHVSISYAVFCLKKKTN